MPAWGPPHFLEERWARFRARWQLLELLPSAGPRALALYAVSWTAGVIIPMGFPIATGALAGAVPGAVGGGVDSPEGRHALAMLGLVAGLFVVDLVYAPVSTLITMNVQRRVDASAQRRVMRAVAAPAAVAHLEDQGYLDDVRMAGAGMGQLVVAVPALVGRLLSAFLSCLIVAQASRLVAVIVFFTVLLQRSYWRRWGLEIEKVMAAEQAPARRAEYLAGLLMGAGAAKEVRIYGLADWLLQRQRTSWRESMAGRWKFFDSALRSFAVGVPLRFAGLAVPYVMLAYSAADGRISMGTFVAAVGAAGNAVGMAFAAGEDSALENLIAAYPAVRKLEARAVETTAAAGRAAEVAGLPRRDIRFEGVSFSYPTGATVYDGFDITIHAGQSLAIVGANGAGKTTLVKLLAGLYRPTAGTITVDGIALDELGTAAWRRQLAVIFQDFARYLLPAADNVGFGAPQRLADRDALERAARRAGALGVVEALPGGWDTVLSRSFTDGADLSGGQWQRIALARAMFAVEAGARVLILDEPTANLDVRAEAELFDRFLELTSGLTTILVSHRFSTVRRAERIVVVDSGRVVEDGSHDELVAAGGRYAAMFALQAARFRGERLDEAAGGVSA